MLIGIQIIHRVHNKKSKQKLNSKTHIIQMIHFKKKFHLQ